MAEIIRQMAPAWLSIGKDKSMEHIRRFLRFPASESSLGVVLSLCVVTMAFMSIAMVWQAQIIANQRDVIRWLEMIKLGS